MKNFYEFQSVDDALLRTAAYAPRFTQPNVQEIVHKG